jgi:hypothetical protein
VLLVTTPPPPPSSGLAPPLHDWQHRTKDANENSVEIDPDNKSKHHLTGDGSTQNQS